MIWPSIHNQLLYPITFSFHKGESVSPYPFYFVYSLVLLLVVILMLVADRERIVRRVFSSRIALGIFGILGSCGIAMLVLCNPTTNFSFFILGLGVSLSGMFLPVFFIFWSLQLVYISKRRVAFDLILSYLLFCVITLIRLAFGLHSWIFAICYPLVSGALAIFVLSVSSPQTKGRFALGKSPIRSLPLLFLIPGVVLVYAATVVRCVMIPPDATYDYPSSLRIIVYACLIVLMLILLFLYRPKGKVRRFADTISLSLVAIFLVGTILIVGIGTLSSFDWGIGNFPVIAGLNAVEVFVWLIVLMNAQTKHTGIILPGAIYLSAVVGVAHLASVIVAGSSELAQFNSNDLPVLAITVIVAFVVVIVVNVLMAVLLYRAQGNSVGVMGGASSRPAIFEEGVMSANAMNGSGKDRDDIHPHGGSSDASSMVPPCVSIATDESVFSNIQEMFGLSKRETDTLRLAVRNKSAKEIAESMYVAESTVNSHIKGIYRKCDVHSRRDLIALVNQFKKSQR